jgi:hypothetical protein
MGPSLVHPAQKAGRRFSPENGTVLEVPIENEVV